MNQLSGSMPSFKRVIVEMLYFKHRKIKIFTKIKYGIIIPNINIIVEG